MKDNEAKENETDLQNHKDLQPYRLQRSGSACCSCLAKIVSFPERALETVKSGIHPICRVSGTSATFFIHGGNRAPRLIKALPEGPSIGLIYGCIDMRIGVSTRVE